MWNIRSQATFVMSIGMAGLLLFQMALHTFQLLFRWGMPPNLFDWCGSWLRSLGFMLLPLLLDVLVFSTLAGVLWLAAGQALSFFRIRSKLKRLRHEEASWELDTFYMGGSGRLVVIEERQHVALTLGFFRPIIVLSTGLLELLDDEELEAVIRHEQFHMNKRDPLRTFLTYMASKVMWYIPVLKWCHHYYKINREVLADRYAIERTGTSRGLGGALLKLLKNKKVSMTFAHASFSDTSMNVRIKQLIEPETSVSIKLPVRAGLISLLTAAFLTLLLLPIQP